MLAGAIVAGMKRMRKRLVRDVSPYTVTALDAKTNTTVNTSITVTVQ